MLEVFVHFELDLSEVPDTYQLLEVEYTGRKGISRLDTSMLPEAWQSDSDSTRSAGDEWLASLSSALLKIPSALIPHSYNYLLNPRHELAKNAKIVNAQSHPYDNRLI